MLYEEMQAGRGLGKIEAQKSALRHGRAAAVLAISGTALQDVRVWLHADTVVLTSNRSFYPTTSAVPPVSFLIIHPRDTNSVVTDSATEKPSVAKESR